MQGANIPFTAKAEQICHDRNILVVPDFIANAGGVICGAVEYSGGTQAIAFQTIEEKLRHNTALVLEKAVHTGMLPRQVAIELAEQRVQTQQLKIQNSKWENLVFTEVNKNASTSAAHL